MNWSLDISSAPRDRQILMRTTRDGDKVFITNWIEPTKHCPNGRFNGFSENAKSLLAWCEIPDFEESPRKAAEAASERTAINPEAKASVDNAATIAPETATAGREMQVGSAPSGSVPATSEGGRDSVERHAPQFIIDDCGSGA